MKILNLLTTLKLIVFLAPFFVDAKTSLNAPYPVSISENKWSSLKVAVQESELTANDGEAYDWYGFSVSISGDWALIGARYHDENGFNSGAAYVYKFDGNNWIEETKLLPDEVGPEDEFGAAVSLSGNWALIGAKNDDDNGENSGAAYLFHFNGVSWEQYEKLLASDGAANDIFGVTLNLNDTRAMVGAILDDDRGDDSGSVYVFDYDGIDWVESDKLYATDSRANDQFGTAISLYGDQALISMVLDDDNGLDSGAVYYFQNTTQWGWMQNSKLFADDGSAHDHFGFSVSLQEGRALIGARTSYVKGQGSGSAYYFENDGSGWDQKEKISANDDAVGGFGWKVKLVDSRAIITAPFDDEAGDLAGSAFVYEYINNAWQQTDKLIGNNTTTNDYFGISADISGSKVLIGASLSDRGFTNTGSAYVFDLEPKFKVNVSVSGLLGNSVILSNGVDTLEVIDNSKQTISMLQDGSDYDVDIISQPEMPNQHCAFDNADFGTINGADVTVNISCVTTQYDVKVSVSGLAATNSVSFSNGGDNLTFNSDDTLIISTLDDGSFFDVSITAQPNSPNQICSFANSNSGNLNGTDYTVTVVCEIAQYSVGGMVSGLANGNVVVMQNNFGDDLAVSTNGAFTFLTQLDDESLFEVTILSHPTEPNQVCTVLQGEGALSGGNYDSVDVQCVTDVHSVGGSVSGLADGNSVTLSMNNGAQYLVVDGNNTFEFVNPLEDGSSYTVMVLNQPTEPNQICEISNGSGTLMGNDISDIDISCETSQYFIGGYLTGLISGNSMIIQNNGGDDLLLTAHGALAFSTPLDDESKYEVTIQMQPNDPIQSCEIINGSGKLLGHDVDNVFIYCELGDDLIYRHGFDEPEIDSSHLRVLVD